jgi:hypothetical protein
MASEAKRAPGPWHAVEVRACNSHDRLLAACQAFARDWAAYRADEGSVAFDDHLGSGTIAAIDDAIAAALNTEAPR